MGKLAESHLQRSRCDSGKSVKEKRQEIKNQRWKRAFPPIKYSWCNPASDLALASGKECPRRKSKLEASAQNVRIC